MAPIEVPMLTAGQCRTISQDVMDASDYWIQRAPFDFYTLGAASYLDGPWDQDPYRSNREKINSILMESFSSLYDQLFSTLMPLLGPGQFHPELAPPGFHIFGARPNRSLLPATAQLAKLGGSIHRDLQYRCHESLWSRYTSVDWDHPLSFTLPLELPNEGGGLNIWSEHQKNERDVEKTKRYIPYQVGTLYWFQGPLLHQIAPQQEITEGDHRITLQGHGLLCDGRWVLYF